MKTPLIYQEIAESINYDNLAGEWISGLNLKRFSDKKTLFDYQEKALKNAISMLFYYYDSLLKYNKNESGETIIDRKKKLYNELWPRERKFFESLGITNKKNKIFFNKIREYYTVLEETGYERIPFYNFVNRMCFWMATGSGKSLVLVKLIEILEKLKSKKLIPNNDILILTQRPDLIEQIKTHIEEFNKNSERKIKVWDLKDSERVKKGSVLRFNNEINVFIYRSDLISDRTTQKNLSFEDIENNGEWYILLDEAHKGVPEDSKRKTYYSIISRKGFIFNFSATFTDDWDIVTTAFNFNLDVFITNGYGKNIYLSKQELDAFKRNKQDFKDKEKQKIILKSLILLTLTKKSKEKLENYHNPLMVALVNSVSKKDSDLQIFFKQLERIALGSIEKQVFEEAKNEVLEEFSKNSEYAFGNETLYIDLDLIKKLNIKDVLEKVFHSKSHSKIEILKIPGNTKELIFQLKGTDKPFGLSKTGDILEIIRNLERECRENYEITESIENKSRFEELNKDNSKINLLMGSRAFYEGWDSNRPNVMIFINIGTGDAKKYVTQSIGRGVRIEPLKNKRKRIKILAREGDSKAKEIISNSELKDISQLETLFVFGTNKRNIEEILKSLEEVKEKTGETIELKINPEADKLLLLIPIYKYISQFNLDSLPKFKGNEDVLSRLISWLEEEKIIFSLLEKEGIEISDLNKIKEFLEMDEKFENPEIQFSGIYQLENLLDHLKLKMRVLDSFKRLNNEIVHFRKIRVCLNNNEVIQLKKIVEKVKDYEDPELREKEIDYLLDKGKISMKEYKEKLKEIGRLSNKEEFRELEIKHLANHYYIPVIVSKEDKIKYINHIIKVKSEREFLRQLEEYLKEENNSFKNFDWWMFSKLDEHTDEIFIPYYNSKKRSIKRFKPDFIFWLKKGKNYYILFVDPKGAEYTDYQDKIDGFERIFGENDKSQKFKFGKNNIFVRLYLHTEDKAKVSGVKYRKYWFDSIKKMIEKPNNLK